MTVWGSLRGKTSVIPLYLKELSRRCLLDGCLIKGFGAEISALEQPPLTLAETANVIGKPVRAVERACAKLVDAESCAISATNRVVTGRCWNENPDHRDHRLQGISLFGENVEKNISRKGMRRTRLGVSQDIVNKFFFGVLAPERPDFRKAVSPPPFEKRQPVVPEVAKR